MQSKLRLYFALIVFIPLTVLLSKKVHGQTNLSSTKKSLLFTPNKGQLKDFNGNSRGEILYSAEGNGINVYIGKNKFSYVVSKIETPEQPNKNSVTSIAGQRIDIEFLNSLSNPTIKEHSPAIGYTNYYYPHCESTKTQSFYKLICTNVYENIDVEYSGGNEQGLKYNIIVNPGANISSIQLKYSGADKLVIENGKLIAETTIGKVVEHMPKVYQIIDGVINEISATYVFINNTTVGFKSEPYNKLYPLIIDPWVSYYGGSWTENGHDVATDALGNVYITGYTNSPDFPVTTGAFQTNLQSGDAFVVKFDIMGNRLWSTYFGGTSDEMAYGVTTDNLGNAIITGKTISSDLPVTTGAYQTNAMGSYDIFIAKFNTTGVLQWATYYGDASDDIGNSVACDNTNNVIITGKTYSSTFPVSASAIQNSLGGFQDAFVLKMDAAGNRLWSSFFGGSNAEEGFDIDVDNASNIFVMGVTSSTDFPATTGAFQTSNAGGEDAFLIKFNAAGNLSWATYCGGSSSELDPFSSWYGSGVCCDNAGNAYISGTTWSNDFPVSTGCFQTQLQGNTDAYLVKFNGAGALQWATYIGGTFDEEGYGVASDNNNDVYVCGDTYSYDFPVTSCAYQTSNGGGGEDNYMSKFSPQGNIICSGYVGGMGHDEMDSPAGHIAVNGGYVYIIGTTPGPYPVTPGAFQTAMGGSTDVYIAQLCGNSCGYSFNSVAFSVSDDSICAGNAVDFFTLSMPCDTTGVTYHWSFSGGTPTSSTLKNPLGITYSSAGIFDVKLVINTPCGNDSLLLNNFITVKNSAAGVFGNTTICNGQPAVIGISGGSTYSWTPASGLSSTTASTVTVLPSVTSVYRVTGIDSIGCLYNKTITVSVGAPVALSVNGPNSVCAGGTTSLSAFGANYYSWTPSSGLSALTGAIVIASPSANTTYTITGTDVAGCTGNIVYTVSVIPRPVALLSSVPGAAVCAGTGVLLSASGGLWYSWSTGATGNTVNVVPSTTTQYKVTVSNSMCDDTASLPIIVHALPIINSPINVTHCLGDSSTISISGAHSYTWSPSVGLSSSTGSFVTTFASATTTYSVTGTSINGCLDTAVIVVNVLPLPVAGISAFPDTFICFGKNIVLTATGALSYKWSTGQTTSVINTSPISNTTYSVIALNGSCSDTAIISVNVLLLPPVVSTPSVYICPGDSALLTASGAMHYSWLPTAGLSSYTAASVTSNPSGTVSFTVTGTDSNGCSNISVSTVNILSPALINAGNNAIILAGSGTPLKGSGAMNYQWTPSNGLACDTCATTMAYPSQTTTYYLTVTDSNGCISIDSVLIEVLETVYEFFSPNAFTPNGDGINDFFAPKGVGIYENAELIIFNRWGELIFKTNNLDTGWNGKTGIKNTDAQIDVYVWKVITHDITGNEYTYYGHVSLIR